MKFDCKLVWGMMVKVFVLLLYVLDLSVDFWWESLNGELKLLFIFIMESIVVLEMFDFDMLKLFLEIVFRDDLVVKKVVIEVGLKVIFLI